MNRSSRLIIGLSVILIVLIALSVSVYLASRDVDCNKCEIEFKNFQVSGMKLDQPIILSVNATDLFEGLKVNECVMKWSRTGGYYYG